MTLLGIIGWLSKDAADSLLKFLNNVAWRYPDLAPKAQEIIAALTATVSLASLISLASALPKEIANIAQGKIEPRDHPSDAG